MTGKNIIVNIIIHARGGQGAVTASQFIAEAAFLSGQLIDVHAYPSFGAERRGAPIQAYAKLSTEEKIWDRSFITNPDILLVFDESVLNQEIVSSLKKDGTFIVNSDKNPTYFKETYDLSKQTKIIVADITKLAIENSLTIDGNPIVNTPILGLLAKALPILTLDNLKKIINKRMNKELSKLNNKLIEQGYNLAKTL
ncbi:MAG: pyruvate ferredoxin oxidoreductase [Promethearchaeota archaeon]|nr:MAG: pyruvate ferredoxin oxidoreductase [Candidatus Lokiarchaeota archaeon]